MHKNNNLYRSSLYGCIALVASLFSLPSHASPMLSGDLADCPFGTPDFNVFKTHTSEGKQFIFDCPFDNTAENNSPLPHNFITRIYNITNDTGVSWLAYDLEVLLLEGGPGNNFGWDEFQDPQLTVPDSVTFMGDMLWVNFDQPLASGETFSGIFRYGEYSSGVARVNGTPKVAKVPEPGIVFLLALGLVGIGFARRRMRS